MMRKPIVSPAPHIHGSQSTRQLMRDVLIALSPSVLVSIYFYGQHALILLLVTVAACVGLEYLIEKGFMKGKKSTIWDLSAAVTGVLLALNLPPATPWWVAVIGAVVAIGVAKMTFGGLGHNIFNPALVGRVFLLISFPVAMTTWTVEPSWFVADAVSGPTPLSMINEELMKGQSLTQIFEAHPELNSWQMIFARAGGSVGEISALALILGFVYLLVRRVIRPHIPVIIVLTVAVLSGIFNLVNPERFTGPVFNVLTGGVLLGAIFMATDYVTSPMSTKGMVIYAVGIGLLTVLIRYFGSYPEGVSFAILIMNAIVPLINKYVKPGRFGKEVTNG